MKVDSTLRLTHHSTRGTHIDPPEPAECDGSVTITLTPDEAISYMDDSRRDCKAFDDLRSEANANADGIDVHTWEVTAEAKDGSLVLCFVPDDWEESNE